jgi:hypothetical protein
MRLAIQIQKLKYKYKLKEILQIQIQIKIEIQIQIKENLQIEIKMQIHTNTNDKEIFHKNNAHTATNIPFMYSFSGNTFSGNIMFQIFGIGYLQCTQSQPSKLSDTGAPLISHI